MDCLAVDPAMLFAVRAKRSDGHNASGHSQQTQRVSGVGKPGVCRLSICLDINVVDTKHETNTDIPHNLPIDSQTPHPPAATPIMNQSNERNDQNGTGPASSEPSMIPPPQRDWWNMTRTIAHYERIEQIGEGTYGQVYRARCKDTDQIVALKKIRVHHGGYWGMPPTVIREIKILKRLRHPNLVQMVEVVSSKGVEHLDEDDEVEEKHKPSKKDRVVDAREGYKGNLFLVLEYVSHDLTGLMDVAFRFSEVQVKCIFRQLLEALEYMHNEKYVHRDIKSSNILIDHNFRVKLADFGLARCIEPPILDKIHDRHNSQEFTNKVITLWYRPPELLLGATRYGTAVDIWSAGCILAELVLGKPIFTGKTEMDQLHLIFELLGTPTQETWAGFQELKGLRTGAVKIDTKRKAKLREKYQVKMSGPTLNLVEKLLELDPQKRLTASRALNSRYFLAEPKAPDRPEDLGPLLVEGGHFHEFQTKKKRREAKQIAEKSRQAALEVGKSEKEAQAEFDAMYRQIMEKVAKEGLNAGLKVDKKDSEKSTRAASEEKARREKSERKRKEKDRDSSRRDRKSSRDARKEEKRRSSSERDKDRSERDKERPSRRKSDTEDSEKRRKRRRGSEAEARREDDNRSKKLLDETETSSEVPSKKKKAERDVGSSSRNDAMPPQAKFSPSTHPGGDIPPQLTESAISNGTKQPNESEADGIGSRRRRRDRSRSRERERRLAREERREANRRRDLEYDLREERRRDYDDPRDRDRRRVGERGVDVFRRRDREVDERQGQREVGRRRDRLLGEESRETDMHRDREPARDRERDHSHRSFRMERDRNDRYRPDFVDAPPAELRRRDRGDDAHYGPRRDREREYHDRGRDYDDRERRRRISRERSPRVAHFEGRGSFNRDREGRDLDFERDRMRSRGADRPTRTDEERRRY